MHTKFTRHRTAYRIEYAKQLLQEIYLRTSTLDAVERKSAFPLKSSILQCFQICQSAIRQQKINLIGKQ